VAIRYTDLPDRRRDRGLRHDDSRAARRPDRPRQAYLETDYELNERKSKATLPYRLAPCAWPSATPRRSTSPGARIARYTKDRLKAGVSRATVNRKLAALSRAFAIAVEQERISSAPTIKKLQETPPAFNG